MIVKCGDFTVVWEWDSDHREVLSYNRKNKWHSWFFRSSSQTGTEDDIWKNRDGLFLIYSLSFFHLLISPRTVWCPNALILLLFDPSCLSHPHLSLQTHHHSLLSFSHLEYFSLVSPCCFYLSLQHVTFKEKMKMIFIQSRGFRQICFDC